MSRQTRKKLMLSVMALAIIASGGAILQFTSIGNAVAQGAGAEMPPMPVPVVSIAEKPVQIWKEFSGRLMAVDYVEIKPQVSGIIQDVTFEDGQIVNKGDVLFKIDPRPYEAAVALARAEVAGAQDSANLAKKELARAEELLKSGAISKQGYDERVNSQKLNDSLIAGASAHLKSAQIDLDHATIRAPISGRISRPEITVGNLVKAESAPLLTTIVSDKDIYADFEVDEQTYLNFIRVKTGQNVEAEKSIPVRLSLPDDDKHYEGAIKSFDNKINPSTGTIRARAIFANADNALLPGMFARVQIGSVGEENMITVPEKAILTDQSRKFVYVSENNVVAYREVKLGDTVNNERVVLSGLNPGDKVITGNLVYKIHPGAKVQPMSEQEMEAMTAQMAKQQQEPAAGEAAPEENSAKDKPKEIPFDEPEKEKTQEQKPAQE